MAEMAMGAAAPDGFRIGRVISRSFEVLSQALPKFLVLSAIASLPFLLLAFISGGLGNFATGTGDPGVGSGTVVGIVVVVVLWIAFICLGQSVAVYGAFQVMRGRPFGLSEAFRRGFARFWPVIGMGLLNVLGFGLGTILLIVPGIIIFIRWAVALPVCVVEQRGPSNSLGRSAELTKGHRWAIFGFFVLYFMVSEIGTKIITFILSFVGGATIGLIGTFVCQTLVTAFYYVAIAIGYHDLRVAKEGIDVDRIASVFD